MSDTIKSLIRHGVTFAGGFLVARGLLDEAMVQEASGAIVTLVSVTWFAISKAKAAKNEK